MKKVIIVLFFALQALTTLAHDPSLAVTNIYEDSLSKKWSVHLQFVQAGLVAALQKKYPFLQNSANEKLWDSCLVQYVRQNLSIIANDKNNVSLGKGAVKIGPHVSEAFFELVNTPTTMDILTVKNSCLMEVYPTQLNLINVFPSNNSRLTASLSSKHLSEKIILRKEMAAPLSKYFLMGAWAVLLVLGLFIVGIRQRISLT